MLLISPAQGAVLAPLARKVPNRISTIDVQPAHTSLPSSNTSLPSPNTSLSSPKKPNRNVGAFVGGTIGVSAIFAVIGIVSVVLRRQRRRRSRPTRILSLSNDSMNAGPQMTVTPSDPNSSEAAQDSGTSAVHQPSVIGGPEAEMVVLHHRCFSLPAVSPLLPPEGFVPVGLSDKEFAQLRAEALSSLPHNLRVSTSDASSFTSSPTAVTGLGETTLIHNTRRLQSEVESLRCEMERRLREIDRLGLRAEGFASGAPNYTSEDE